MKWQMPFVSRPVQCLLFHPRQRCIMNLIKLECLSKATVHEDGTYNITKHFAMGRVSFELSFVMPDNHTVYMTEDGDNRVMTVYKTETPGDLSSGTLYAAKVHVLPRFGNLLDTITTYNVVLGFFPIILMPLPGKSLVEFDC